jgi:hypothetical protein
VNFTEDAKRFCVDSRDIFEKKTAAFQETKDLKKEGSGAMLQLAR